MSKMKKILALVLSVATVLSMCAMLTACKKNTDAGNAGSAEAGKYTVTVKSAGGLPLENVAVSVYADDSLSDMKGYDETDENGAASIELEGGSYYAITLSGVPKGYAVEKLYRFDGTNTEITLTSSLITGESLGDTTLGLGDVMYDFTVTAPDGTKVVLSEILKQKKMVLLNFWYTGCSWCVTEFPYMEQAYQQFVDDVGIVAVDPLGETDAAIAAFPSSYNLSLSFPLAACPSTWANTFGITGYPTSVIIDRYGVICLIEAGAITSLTPFTSLFETMTADNYTQKLYGSVSELIVNPKPTFTMDTPENVAALLNNGQIPVTYHAEEDEDSKEYAWPFIEAEKLGQKCLKASNQGIDSSFGVIYADVELKAGQALGLDYLMSSEGGSDTFVVIVDGQDIFTISGVNDPEKWESCYPVVADKDGTHEVALFYLKDESNSAGDDTVYIKNVRIIDAKDIDTATYLPREAATSADGFAFDYVELVLSSKDGYYHVGSENGPLLLADLMGYTQFNEESSIWDMAYGGKIVVDGKDYLEQLEQYCNYASNAKGGICTVNQELYELLQMVDKAAGFDEADTKEWMKACKYFQAYGTSGGQLEDPIKGLAPFSAYTAKEGKNISSNYFYYDRIIMPRGLLAEFVPSKSGVYRITSRTESTNGVEGWIFDGNHTELLVYEQDERLFNDNSEVSMVYYMEKGKSYYIDIAFWDPYEVGTIYYDIEYVAAKLNHFRLCSPGYFTYDTNATGDAMYHLITGGIKAVLGSDGIYYEDLGNGKMGSKIYADFTGLTSMFSAPISTVNAYNSDGSIKKDENGKPVMVKGMIDLGGFDFSKNENDLYVLGIMAKNGNDIEKTKAALKEEWGESYDTYAAEYQIEDVFAGKYHGKGQNLTAEISTYLDDVINSGAKELRGCVVVTERLAEILQLLMDKYTFEDVDQSWLKVCYYYDYLGA